MSPLTRLGAFAAADRALTRRAHPIPPFGLESA
jgi:hypothetical protein